jgi:hypothetical protein
MIDCEKPIGSETGLTGSPPGTVQAYDEESGVKRKSLFVPRDDAMRDVASAAGAMGDVVTSSAQAETKTESESSAAPAMVKRVA